ncbi:protein of unknown function [Thermomonospora echinospora]|uniref:DUF397 domain-containing protein n=1 Tax=Thermomonospora echinospora TaxID=1992 RepID=A0A1H6CP40_9ACTN|nr:DUF397 domain-containing protein [Thermomonospora echinospora]SEG74365.1 protein of unknown function [Thermomonospora echinospora]
MAIHWRKSSHSGSSNDEFCVELAELPAGVAIRDSKDPEGEWLTVRRTAFAELIRLIQDGALDR